MKYKGNFQNLETEELSFLDEREVERERRRRERKRIDSRRPKSDSGKRIKKKIKYHDFEDWDQ